MTSPGTVWKHAAAVCWFLLYAVASSWPLALNLSTHIPGNGAGDNVAFLWNVWWFRQAAFNPDAQLFYTTHLFAPFGAPLVLHTHTALPALIGATLLRPMSAAAAHNVVLLAGLAANGIAAYALAWHHARAAGPALLAGTVFAGSAYISIHMLGHFNLVHAWVLPLAALTWIRFVDAPSVGRGAVAGAAFAAAAYTDYYYCVYIAMFAAIWIVLRAFPFDIGWSASRLPVLERFLVAAMAAVALLIVAIVATGGFRLEAGPLHVSASHIRNPVAGLWLLAIAWLALRVRVRFARTEPELAVTTWTQCVPGLASAAAVMLALTLPLSVAAAQMAAAGDYVSPPHTWRSGPRGIDVLTMVLGNPLGIEAGRRIYARLGIDMMEQAAWIGIVPIVIFIAALTRRLRPAQNSRRWMWIAVFFFVWSCGAYLRIAGVDTGLPLPQAAARFIPLVSNARMPGRAMAMAQLAVAVLGAIAITRLRWRGAAVAGLVALAVADNGAALPLYMLPGPDSIDRALAQRAAGQAVVELPMGLRDGFGEAGRFDHRALVHQIAHGHPIAGGFVGRLPDRVRKAYEQTPALASLMRLGVEPAELPADLGPALLDLGITHVIVNTDAMTIAVRDQFGARGVRLVMVDGPRELYLVGGAP